MRMLLPLLATLFICGCDDTPATHEHVTVTESETVPLPPAAKPVAKMSALESRLNGYASAGSMILGSRHLKWKMTTVYYIAYDDGSTREVELNEYMQTRVPNTPSTLDRP